MQRHDWLQPPLVGHRNPPPGPAAARAGGDATPAAGGPGRAGRPRLRHSGGRRIRGTGGAQGAGDAGALGEGRSGGRWERSAPGHTGGAVPVRCRPFPSRAAAPAPPAGLEPVAAKEGDGNFQQPRWAGQPRQCRVYSRAEGAVPGGTAPPRSRCRTGAGASAAFPVSWCGRGASTGGGRSASRGRGGWRGGIPLLSPIRSGAARAWGRVPAEPLIRSSR